MIPTRNSNVVYANPTPPRFNTSTRLTENALNGNSVSIDSFNPTNLVNRALGYNGAGGGGYTIRRSFNDYGGGMPINNGNNDLNFRMKMGRSVEKSRGLRHFSHKVCEKVKEKGQTNYNEVADELVAEYFDSLPEPPTNSEKQQYETKNIRRRVYDALNVLMAMNIIEKEKKEIHWECKRLEEEKLQRQERLRQKTEQLHDLIIQLVTYKSLVQKNREREREIGRANEASLLYLPYIIVSTDKKTMVDCCISPDKSEYWFNFDHHFEIHDDIEVLKRMGLAYGLDCGEVPNEHISHIKACLPAALRDYVDQIIEGGVINKTGKGSQTVSISTQERKPPIKYGLNDSQQPIALQGRMSGAGENIGRNSMGNYNQRQPNPQMARFTVIPRSANTSERYSMSHQQQYQPQQQYVYSRGLPTAQQQRQYLIQHDSPIQTHRNMPLHQQRQYSQYQSQNQGYHHGMQTHGGHIIGGEEEYLETEDVYEEEDENLDYHHQ